MARKISSQHWKRWKRKTLNRSGQVQSKTSSVQGQGKAQSYLIFNHSLLPMWTRYSASFGCNSNYKTRWTQTLITQLGILSSTLHIKVTYKVLYTPPKTITATSLRKPATKFRSSYNNNLKLSTHWTEEAVKIHKKLNKKHGLTHEVTKYEISSPTLWPLEGMTSTFLAYLNRIWLTKS